MKKAWIIAGSVVGAIVVAIVAWIVIDLCVTSNAEVAENLIYESFDEMEKEVKKMAEKEDGSFTFHRDFFTIEDVTQIGKDKDNAEYFLVTYRVNGAEFTSAVVKVEEKNGEPKGEFVDDRSYLQYLLFRAFLTQSRP